ncbi:MAG: flagellar motor switch protein FliG [Treponema sp.]|nr:flagellar motor switch protein FliG [Treponema sp.]
MKLSDFGINAYNKNKKDTDSKKSDSKNSRQNFFSKSESVQNNQKNQKKQFEVPETHYEGNLEAKAAAKALVSGGLLKVPETKRELDGRDNVYRRVAKFLLLIGVDEAAKILPHLSESQTEKIIPEIATIRTISSDEAESILEEFKGLFDKARSKGGIETAKIILDKAFGEKKADELLEKVEPYAGGKPFEYLSETDAERVSILLKDESNPVRALVLSYLKPKTAAAVISAMDDESKKDVILRLAKLKEVNPDIVKRVDKAMQEKMNALATSKSDKIDGKSTLAQILKRMSPEAEEGILNQLSESDPNLGADLRERLFTIEDILNADDKYLQKYLVEADEEDLAYLIAGKDDDFRNKILKNVSENKRKLILETEDFLKLMRKSDCEKATSKFFSAMRRAYEDGKLYIKGRDDEIYV